MVLTRVINITKEKELGFTFIGRGSIFGNPFHIGKDGSRGDVIHKYKVYFYNRITADNTFKEAVLGLRGKVLGCFCKPLSCHGCVILEYLLSVFGGTLIDEFTAEVN